MNRVICIDDLRVRASRTVPEEPRTADRVAPAAVTLFKAQAASSNAVTRWLAPLLFRYRNVISIQAGRREDYPGTFRLPAPPARS